MKRIYYILISVLMTVCISVQGISAQAIGMQDLKLSLSKEQSRFLDLRKEFDIIRANSVQRLETEREHTERLSVQLYACKMDYVFDLTYLLQQVKSEYATLEHLAQPNRSLIQRCDLEVMRYDKLLNSLHAPEQDSLDWMPMSECDTIILYARNLKDYYERMAAYEYKRSAQYEALRADFEPTYQYALSRYEEVKTGIIQQNASEIWESLPAFATFASYALNDAKARSSHSDSLIETGEFTIILCQMLGSLLLCMLIFFALSRWKTFRNRSRRIMENTFIWCNFTWVLTQLMWLIIDIHVLHLPALSTTGATFYGYIIYVCLLQIALLIREHGERASVAMHLYAPSLFMGLVLIFMRLFYLPNSTLQLLFFPEAIITFIWQIIVLIRFWNRGSKMDSIFALITCIVLGAEVVAAFFGYAFYGIQIYLWWQMELGILVLVASLYALLNQYHNTQLLYRTRLFRERKKNKNLREEDAIQITWFYQLMRMVILPLTVTASLPLCMYIAMDLFNDGNTYLQTFNSSFFDLQQGGEIVLSLSLRNLSLVLSLFFIFNYLKGIIIGAYHQIRLALLQNMNPDDAEDSRQMNIAIGDNLIPFIVWTVYVADCFVMLNIPLSALTYIFAGLATGIGFASRDILNNLFYGIQLMAGKLHVGDYIICGNYRGAVTNISYQTTQMLTEEGAMVNFSNADLFSRNFMNLTSHNPYEVNRIEFSVAYGKDLSAIESLVTHTMESLNRKDKDGCPLLSGREGIRVELQKMNDAGCLFTVRFGVIAERRTWFLPVARKAIYEALVANGYDIPFTKYELIGK